MEADKPETVEQAEEPEMVQETDKPEAGEQETAAKADEQETPEFPVEEMFKMTKHWVENSFRPGALEPEIYSEDMIFRGPEAGPFMKKQYLEAMGAFNLPEAFPDMDIKSFGYSIDPTDPYRVWYFAQITGSHTGNFNFAGNIIPATGGQIHNGTQAGSIIWTPDRKIKYISVGYCCDRINSDTPNGTMRVAVVGMLRAMGKEWLWDLVTNPAVRWFGRIAGRLQGKPDIEPKYEDLPDWWKALPDGHLRNSQNYPR